MSARIWPIVAVLVVGCRYYGSTTPAAAPPYTSHAELGAVAGIHTFATDSSLGSPSPPARDSLRESAAFGARAGWYFGRYFGVEAQLAVVPTEATTTVYDVWVVLAEARAIYAPFGDTPDHPVVPFLFGGAALYDVVSSGAAPGTGITSGSLLAPDGGLGIKDSFDNGWGVRADATVLFASAVGGGVTEDLELMLSIYRSFAAPPRPVE